MMSEPALTGLEIAVLAVAGRFPSAPTVEDFWQRLRNGEDLIRRFSVEELRQAGASKRDLEHPDYVHAFGAIEDPALFDAGFFDFTPRDAELVDPQHRLLLENAWEALERAGYDSEQLPGAPIGVFVGCNSNTYFIQQILPWLSSAEAVYMSPGFGHDKDHLSSLLAYKLGCEGPCATVQSACSTGLVAAHMACQALLNGECDLALAGASSVIFPQHGYLSSAVGFISRQAACRAFDHRADGIVPANGVGVVVLKRLEDALADRDPILAVIKGSAMNNDGASRSGYTAPRRDGQAKVVRAAQMLAEVAPDTLQYIETHGSATALGDPVEVDGLTRAFRASSERDGTQQNGFCAIGSVKSNCGHTGTAAGATGLIKTVLSLHHRQIPPSLHFEKPNPEIDFANSPFFVNTELRDWPDNADTPRRAAVTSLGLGGANAHLILEEAPTPEASGPSRPMQLLLLSAKTPSALDSAAERLADHLENNEDDLADVAFTLGRGRRRFRHRRAVVARNAAQAAERLRQRAKTARAGERPPKVAFLLPGLGDLTPGLARELDQETAFRQTLDACAEHLRPILGEDLRTLLFQNAATQPARLFGRAATPSLPTRQAHPALFSLEVALAEQWKAWGVQPTALLGYSLGELTAAHLAGTLTLEDALALVSQRAKLIDELPPGAMVAVPLPVERLEPRLGLDLTIAARSAPEQTVIAGPTAAVEALEAELTGEEIVCRRIATSHAFHSPMMAGAADALARALARVELRAPTIPWLSNVSGDWIRDEEATSTDYWVRHLLSPVRLDRALKHLLDPDLDEPIGALIEVGPGQALASLALQHPLTQKRSVTVTPSFLPGQGDLEGVLIALGKLWGAGLEFDLDAFYRDEKRRRVLLPTYPFERQRYWMEAPPTVEQNLPERPLERVETVTPKERIEVVGDLEGRIRELWREVLGIETIDLDDNFFELGGHSLAGLRITSRLGKDLGQEVPLKALFETPTIRQLASALRSFAGEEDTSSPRPVPREPGEALPLSFAQERLWFLARLVPDSPAYNIPSPVRLEGELDVEHLRAALNGIVARHENLRTRFVLWPGEDGDEPVQIIDEHLELAMPIVDLTQLGEEDRALLTRKLADAEARRTFDLENGPLLRVTLLRAASRDHLALFTVHHMVSDGWSTGVLIGELARLYRALQEGEKPSLPALPLQYADVAIWQRRAFAAGRLDEQIEFWRAQLDGLPRLNLPSDRPRTEEQRFRGDRAFLRLDAELSMAIETLARQHQGTLFMALLALARVWLGRLSGEPDFALGTPIAGRREPSLEPLIGFFVNTLVLRGRIDEARSFADLLDREREAVLEAFDHQDLPFEKLVEALQPRRDLARTPFFDVMLALQNVPFEALELPGLRLSGFDFETGSAKFDLTLSFWQGEDGLRARADFDLDLFDPTTVERWLRQFEQLCRAVVERPDADHRQLNLLPAGERQLLLVEWNDTRTQFAPTHLAVLVSAQVCRTPDALALIDDYPTALSYGELLRRARSLARHLLAQGVEPETRIAVDLERSPELVIGLLAVLEVGAAYVPIDPSLPEARRDLLLQSADLVIDAFPDLQPNEVELPEPRPDALAYVIHTSGSTGLPKGVMISHRAICNRLLAEAPLGVGDRVLQRSSIGFDVSVREIFWPLLHGATIVLAPPAEESLLPIATLLRQRVNVASFVPSLLDVALEEPEMRQASALRHMISSGEALSPSLAGRFYKVLPACELTNRYGPSEAAIGVTVYLCSVHLERTEGSTRETRTVPIGRPVRNTSLAVLDPHLRPQAIGVAGELTIAGVQLARGYQGLPGRTARSFVPDALTGDAGGRRYRTGDLARLRADGEIEFLGRIDQQLKVHGVRLEPGEVESVLLEHPAVEAVAVVKEGVDLIAWIVSPQVSPTLADALRRFAMTRLPDALVPRRVLFREALPRLSSGKIDRQKLSAEAQSARAERTPGFDLISPEVENEQLALLSQIWTELLDVEQPRPEDDFFALGGHSLLATRLISRVRRTFSVELPLRTLFEAPTLIGLSQAIEEALRLDETPLPPIEPREPQLGRDLPLSFAQQRLWLLDRLVPNNPFYNMSTTVRVLGAIDLSAFGRAVQGVIDRHESLRTTFHESAGDPCQRIADTLEVPVVLVDLQHLTPPDRSAQLSHWLASEERRPFAIDHGALIRAMLLRTGREDQVLLVTLHHIIADGWSMGVLYQDIVSLYHAFTGGTVEAGEVVLPPLPVQYADFSLWQRRWLKDETLGSQLAYWKEQLKGMPRTLDLPTDRPIPRHPTFRGGGLRLHVPHALRLRLDALAKRSQATLAMLLLSAFKTLLFRLSGQTDFAVGLGIANRQRLELENLIGFFVNTLVLRGQIENSGRQRFADLLDAVRQTALSAYAHQDLPFERLVGALDPERDLSRNPLVQVMFGFQNYPRQPVEVSGLRFEMPPEAASDRGTSKFDLTLFLYEDEADEAGEKGLRGQLEYNSDLFDRTTIERWREHFRRLLEALVEQPDRSLLELDGLSPAQRQQLIAEVGTIRPRENVDLTTLFLRQATRRGDALAVIDGEASWSYSTLARQAQRLAEHLQELDIQPEERVGVDHGRSFELLVAMLGILQAGAAYVPLDPAYPPERLDFMVRDAAIRILVTSTEASIADWVEGLTTVDLSQLSQATEALQRIDRPAIDHDQLAYVMYTSGSTGQPKGVGVVHGAVSRLVLDTDYLRLGSDDRLTHLASPSFDATTFEIWGALLTGGTVVISDRDTALDLPAFGRLLRQQRITTAFLTTALFNRFAYQEPEALSSLRHLLFGGEAVDRQAVRTFQPHFEGQLIHAYGPTECTTFATAQTLEPGEDDPNPAIGRAIAHTRARVLDKALGLAWPGTAGELCLGGDGLARGYLGRPATTAEAFFPDPNAVDDPGARLYHTGDLVHLLPDGNLRFLRRLDAQVKLRGFRLELTEIEAILSQHPGVRASAARIVERGENRQLVAYVAPQPHWHGDAEEDANVKATSVRDWREIFDDLYQTDDRSANDPSFDIVGWESTYTGQALPAEEMREWLDDTITRLRLEKPRRVLEIGCGTGLLLFQLAPDSERYHATDLSSRAVDLLRDRAAHLPQVELQRRPADDFDGLPADFDLVILNSVSQYFPELDYLARVLDGAAERIRPGGAFFVGDVRDLPLLDAFHAAVENAQAEPKTSADVLRQRLAERRAQEHELVVDPDFFHLWAERNPGWRAEVFLKRGQAINEMNAYRYQVVLRRADPTPVPPDWQNWQEGWTVERLLSQLREERPERLALHGIPNARTAQDVAFLKALQKAEADTPVESLREEAARHTAQAVDPHALLQRLTELDYEVELGGSKTRGAQFELVLQRREEGTRSTSSPTLFRPPSAPLPSPTCWDESGLANDPLEGHFARRLAPDLRRFLEQRLPAFMVPAFFVKLDALPLTPNGKVDRRALPEPQILQPEAEARIVPPRTPLEADLAKIWGEVLQVERLGVEDDFFALGGHSLLATQVVSRIRQGLGLDLPLRLLFEASTIAELAGHLEAQHPSLDEPPLVPQERDGDPPLSFAQERLWFLDRLEPGAGKYHEAAAVRLVGELRLHAFQASLNQIVERHETLRTTFPAMAGRPVQRIADAADNPTFAQAVVDLSALRPSDHDTTIRRLSGGRDLRRFDLVRGPLCRVLMARQQNEDHVVLFGFHHILFDGWSIGVFLRELAAGYEAALTGRRADLPALPVQYADFALWQRRWLRLDEQLAWWREHLDGVPNLDLPTDRPRGSLARSVSGLIPWRLDPNLHAGLQRLAKHHGTTLHMALLAALEILLFRLTGQRDFAIGNPVANRNRMEIEGLIGFFVNMLVMRAEVDPRRGFAALLERVRRVSVEAYSRQDVPFERLVEALQPERHLDRSALFQVAFQLLDLPGSGLDLPGLESLPYSVARGGSKFDLSLNLSQRPETVGGRLDYRADLFDRTTVLRLLGQLSNLIEDAIRHPNRPLQTLDLLGASAKHQIFHEWNDTTTERSRLVPELLREVAEKRAEAIAVVDDKAVLTYGELAAQADHVAHRLRKLDPETIVGVSLPRSIEAMVSVFAILQAGCAYLPLPPDLPPDRRTFLLEDARPAVVLNAEPLGDRASSLVPGSSIKQTPSRPIEARQLAYVLYTSGSTGRPKAVMVPHGALANHMAWYGKTFPMRSDDALLHKTPATFDVSVGEWLAPLLAGARLVLARPDAHRDPEVLNHDLTRHRITTLHLVPSQLRVWRSTPDRLALRYLFSGGEILDADLARETLARLSNGAPGSHLFNVYGPAEAAIRATAHEVANKRLSGSPVPVGRPIPNLRALVLDEALQPVPPGVVGALMLGGSDAGPGRGYLGRPSLTAERFLPDPFSQRPGARLYRTGDRARHLPSGEIVILGRQDQQIKLRGMRFELGEVEALLRRHPAILEAAAVLLDENGDQRLAMGFVPNVDVGADTQNLDVDSQDLDPQNLRTFLQRDLPDALVPGTFRALDALPRLSSGKLDRQALASLLAQTTLESRSSRPPRDALELEMVRLWEEVLGRSGLGPEDDFFVAGGHSLLAVQLIERITERFGQRLPLTRLFEAATPEHLADALRADGTGEDLGELISLRARGPKPPLFLVHPLGGDVIGYRDLARALGDEQPVHAFQARGLRLGEVPDSTIEAMAERYVAALLKAGFNSPFQLGGWSLGGIVAFDMARQLLDRGYEVDALRIIDGRARRPGTVLPDDDPRFWTLFGRHLGLDDAALAQAGEDFLQLDLQARLRRVARIARASRLLPAENDVALLEQRLRVFRAHLQAATRYDPQPLDVEICLFQASDLLYDRQEDLAAGWRAIARGVHVETIPGNHHNLVRGESAKHLAGAIESTSAEENDDARSVSGLAHQPS